MNDSIIGCPTIITLWSYLDVGVQLLAYEKIKCFWKREKLLNR